jgi:hypothetical protein
MLSGQVIGRCIFTLESHPDQQRWAESLLGLRTTHQRWSRILWYVRSRHPILAISSPSIVTLYASVYRRFC